MAGEAAAAAVAEVELAPPVPDPSAGAFFDVDNTLMRGASIYHFARGLAARKMFGPRDLARMTWGQVTRAEHLPGGEAAGKVIDRGAPHEGVVDVEERPGRGVGYR